MTSFLKLVIAILIFGSVAMAQTSTPIRNFYAVGGSYNFNGQPNVAGTAMYGRYVAAPGTYGYTVIDVLPNSVKPFTVTNNIGGGLAQNLFTVGRFSLIMPTAAGISWNGSNTGWQYTGGAAGFIRIKPGFYLVPTARFLKSSVSNGSGLQPILGLEIGFGQ